MRFLYAFVGHHSWREIVWYCAESGVLYIRACMEVPIRLQLRTDSSIKER